jgi:hypothetical protein
LPYSKRAFDGLIKEWRRKLWTYQPKAEEDEIQIDLDAEDEEEINIED